MKHLKENMMRDPAIALPALAHFAKMHKSKGIKERQSADRIQSSAIIGDESKMKVNDVEISPAIDYIVVA